MSGISICRIGAVLLTLTIVGCSSDKATVEPMPVETSVAAQGPNGGLLSKWFGLNETGQPPPGSAAGRPGIGVNSYLWRASLDTISFMPLTTADPFGGVIITDWYSPPEMRGERFKVTVYILDRELRADGLRVAVFRQNRGPEGAWVAAPVEPATARDLENAILKRARQMRVKVAQ